MVERVLLRRFDRRAEQKGLRRSEALRQAMHEWGGKRDAEYDCDVVFAPYDPRRVDVMVERVLLRRFDRRAEQTGLRRSEALRQAMHEWGGKRDAE